MNNEQVRRINYLLRAGRRAKKDGDLVELYADERHDHGILSFILYKWNFIQYYNIDVWLVIVSNVMMIIWSYCKFVVTAVVNVVTTIVVRLRGIN